jgi:hypothetical protein
MSENSHFKEHFVLAVSLLILCFFGGYKMAENHFREHTEMVTDTLIVERWDTVRIIEPTEIVRYVTRHDTIKLFDNLEPLKPTIIDDSTVVIPIESITYKDSTENAQYTAYISGFRAELDSININCKNTETVITNTIEIKPRRFGVGIQLGIGVSPQGVAAPYFGIGVQYRLW